ncbi:MAG: alpha/beta hydrolase [Pseudomonadota bacterium]
MTAHHPPSKALWAAELPRAAWGIVDLLRQRRALGAGPRGAGQPVMLLPGLFNSDRSNFILRRHLIALDHDAHGWGLGRNLGTRTIGTNAERLIERIADLADRTGRPVALVGVSLGGMIARLIAQRRPELVRQVITVASPYAGDGRATNVWRAFEWFTGEKLSDPAVVARSAELAAPLPVPATAIWSRSDGLVNGLICHAADEENCRAIEIRSSHLGVQLRPAVLRIVAEVLAT